MRDWALSWRVRPDKDMRVIPNTSAVELDPSATPPGETLGEPMGAKVIIDATKKMGVSGHLPSLQRVPGTGHQKLESIRTSAAERSPDSQRSVI